MNNLSRHISEAVGASISMVATISVWQTEMEFWLRIAATAVAIAAGLSTIWSALRKKTP